METAVGKLDWKRKRDVKTMIQRRANRVLKEVKRVGMDRRRVNREMEDDGVRVSTIIV